MDFQTVLLFPSDIRFTQDSVSDRFHDGTTIDERLDDLRRGVIRKWEIPMMKVVHRWGKWWSLNNRRLLVFKKFSQCGRIKAELIPWACVDKDMWERKYTTTTDGLFAFVRESNRHNQGYDQFQICACTCHVDNVDSDCSVDEGSSDSDDYYYY